MFVRRAGITSRSRYTAGAAWATIMALKTTPTLLVTRGSWQMESINSFGYWLRRRRNALDLTQDALARQAGCALCTLKKIETDERRPSRQLAEWLANCLAIPAAERAAFLKAARAELATDQLAMAAPLIEAAAATTRLPSGTVILLFTDIEGSATPRPCRMCWHATRPCCARRLRRVAAWCSKPSRCCLHSLRQRAAGARRRAGRPARAQRRIVGRICAA